VPKPAADLAFLNATCIGCGACVAACPNGSAMLFTAAKVAHLKTLPQGQPEREIRVRRMVETMDQESFGGCTNTGECVVACPKGIPLGSIANLNREYLRSRRLRLGEPSARMRCHAQPSAAVGNPTSTTSEPKEASVLIGG
jgi:succinate dehydrogenase / fumarate reductase iron-sulfur subunit